MAEKYLWSFYWDCGRSGSIDGLFVATESKVKSLVGMDVNFGEVLGKHSEVYGTFTEGDFHKNNVSPSAVEEVAKVLGDTWSGFNPFDYIHCAYCGETCDDILYREEFTSQMCEECFNEELNNEELVNNNKEE